jgi:hypothetical protein
MLELLGYVIENRNFSTKEREAYKELLQRTFFSSAVEQLRFIAAKQFGRTTTSGIPQPMTEILRDALSHSDKYNWRLVAELNTIVELNSRDSWFFSSIINDARKILARCSQ